MNNMMKALKLGLRNYSSSEGGRGILVLNAGSSSLKFTCFTLDIKDILTPVFTGSADGLTVSGDVLPTISVKHDGSTVSHPITQPTHNAALDLISKVTKELSSAEVVAVGHRIVHGGERFTQTCLIEDVTNLQENTPLAPLHNPHNVAGVKAALEHFNSAIQVGVFDTAYHSTIPRHVHTYALPSPLSEQYRRYGFHGTSHKYVVGKAARYLGKKKINAISFHLGNGCSVACIKDNKSIDTSMGYTPLAGLPMGTRSGDIDPSIILHLIQERGFSASDVNYMLHSQSGLFGLCGSSDSRAVEQGYEEDSKYKLAFDIFTYNVKKYLGAYKEVLEDKVDCIIFTAGIGENSPLIHRLVCDPLYPVSHTNYSRNNEVSDITGAGRSLPKVLVVKTNEELAIAQECLQFL